MGGSRQKWRWALIGTGILVVAGLALVYANDWWLSGVMTVSIFAWLTGVLAAIYSRPERRAIVIGAVLAGFLYVLFALGPWFRVHIGPWLLTSQALVHVETKWLGRQPQVQQIAFTTSPNPVATYGSAGSTILTLPQVVSGATLTMVANAPPGYSPAFVVLGHWLFAWLAAGLGAIVAGWMSGGRRQAPATSAAEVQP